MKSLISLLLFVVALVGAQRYGLPAWESFNVSRANIAKFKAAKAEAKSLESVRDDLISRYNSVSAEKHASLEALLPKSIAKEDVYVFFEKIILDSGMRVKTISLTESTEAEVAGGQKTLTFVVNATGSYEKSRVLLDEMENNLRLMDITSINVNRDTKDGFMIELKGTMYYGN